MERIYLFQADCLNKMYDVVSSGVKKIEWLMGCSYTDYPGSKLHN